MENLKNNNANIDIVDALKLKEIDQLHAVTLQFSKNTIQLKTICSSILIGLITVILNITKGEFNVAIIWACFIAIISFWIIDSYSYYYQRKTRIKMTEKINQIRKDTLLSDGFGIPLATNEKYLKLKALFNLSHIFYYIAFLAVLTIMIFYKLEIIK